MSQVNSNLCSLRLVAQNRVEPCTGEVCAFWEPGGAVLPGGCMLERLHVDLRRPHLATYLIELRERLDDVKGERR